MDPQGGRRCALAPATPLCGVLLDIAHGFCSSPPSLSCVGQSCLFFPGSYFAQKKIFRYWWNQKIRIKGTGCIVIFPSLELFSAHDVSLGLGYRGQVTRKKCLSHPGQLVGTEAAPGKAWSRPTSLGSSEVSTIPISLHTPNSSRA